MNRREELDTDTKGAELAAEFEAWCVSNGHRVRFGMVDTNAAAAILERAPGTLKNWARVGAGPPCRRGGYLIRDLADFWLAERE